MNEPEPPILNSRTAFALGATLLVGFGALTVLGYVDRKRTTTIEQFKEDTAVGDRVHYLVPKPVPNPPTTVATLDGRALVPVSFDKVECRDTKMRPVALDAQTRLTIYRSREPLPNTSPGESAYYVKTASNEYLRLRPATSAQ